MAKIAYNVLLILSLGFMGMGCYDNVSKPEIQVNQAISCNCQSCDCGANCQCGK